MPKVSVIIPIYNVERYLDRCVQSVLSQTLKDIEIILVDDGSPDGCPAMCDEYAKKDCRVKVIHKKNGGLGYARNSGLEIATGEYVAFVDSDDFIDVKMYETLYLEAKSGGYDTVFCNCHFYTDTYKQNVRKDVDHEIVFNGRNEIDSFLLDMVGPLPDYKHDVKYMMSVWHAIYSNELIKNKALRFVSEREFISEDIIFDIDYLSIAEKICYLPNAFYYYCLNKNSLSRKYNHDRYDKNKKLLLEVKRKLSDIFDEKRFRLHYQRLKLLYLRNSLQYIIEAKQENDIKMVLNDSFWEHLLCSYPFQKMDLRHRIFFSLIKSKSIFLIRMIFKIAI